MPSPKSGKAGTAVTPVAPDKALEADVANPGKVDKVKFDQRFSKGGKSDRVNLKPHKQNQASEEQEKKKSWIEIELRDDHGKPIPGEPYEIVLPGGGVLASGSLDEKGSARVDGIDPGQAKVHFPNQEDDQWKRG